jgi:hypothetical protein
VKDLKPLKWTPQPGVGMTVARLTDGGMNLTFTDMKGAEAWLSRQLDQIP